MKHRNWQLVALICTLTLWSEGIASAPSASGNSLAAYITEEGSSTTDGMAPMGGAESQRLKELDAQYREALYVARIAQAEFATNATKYQMQAYRTHLFWSNAAATMVYLLTGFGMLCAGVQFRLWDRIRGRYGPDVTCSKDNAESAGIVELPGGAKVSSPFLGVVILVISLAFFSLYLTEVYPIKPSNSPPLALQSP